MSKYRNDLTTLVNYAISSPHSWNNGVLKLERSLLEIVEKFEGKRAIDMDLYESGLILGITKGCPTCRTNLIYNYTHKPELVQLGYCPNCGQKIDWSVQL